jgi:transcriptional antiterminator RfaH
MASVITQALRVVAMSFRHWAVVQLDARHVRLALHCLEKIEGYTVYAPRLRETRIIRHRKVRTTPLLFVSYAFVFIIDHWWAASRTPGVIRLVLDHDRPARVGDHIIEELRSRERDGLIELAEQPRFRPGDPVRVTKGAFAGRFGIFADQAPRERVAVLMALLGGGRVRVELPEAGIEAVRAGVEAVRP